MHDAYYKVIGNEAACSLLVLLAETYSARQERNSPLSIREIAQALRVSENVVVEAGGLLIDSRLANTVSPRTHLWLNSEGMEVALEIDNRRRRDSGSSAAPL